MIGFLYLYILFVQKNYQKFFIRTKYNAVTLNF